MKPKNHSKKINFLFFREIKNNRTFFNVAGIFLFELFYLRFWVDVVLMKDLKIVNLRLNKFTKN
jgi:hypothetical protein